MNTCNSRIWKMLTRGRESSSSQLHSTPKAILSLMRLSQKQNKTKDLIVENLQSVPCLLPDQVLQSRQSRSWFISSYQLPARMYICSMYICMCVYVFYHLCVCLQVQATLCTRSQGIKLAVLSSLPPAVVRGCQGWWHTAPYPLGHLNWHCLFPALLGERTRILSMVQKHSAPELRP